ncbi:ankyrin repeat domain-containing protein [Flavobacterium pedocola]
MRKTISLLALAIAASTNVALASNVESATLKNVAIVKYDVSPLCVAISKGDLTTVKKFIEYGMNINETKNGMTPLMFAARYNQPEIAKLLIEKGAKVWEKDLNGFTALQHAEAGKAEKVIEVLKSVPRK